MGSQNLDLNKEEDLLLLVDTLVELLDSGLIESDKRLEISSVKEKISRIRDLTILNHSMIIFEKLREVTEELKDRGYGFKSIDNVRNLKFISLDLDALSDDVPESQEPTLPTVTFEEVDVKPISTHLEGWREEANVDKEESQEEKEEALEVEERDPNEPFMDRIVELIDKGIIPLHRPIKLIELKKIMRDYGYVLTTPPNLAVVVGNKLKKLGEKKGYVFNVGSKTSYCVFRPVGLVMVPGMVGPESVEAFVARRLARVHGEGNLEYEKDYSTGEILIKIFGGDIDDCYITKKQFKELASSLNDRLVEFDLSITVGARNHSWVFIKRVVPEEYRQPKEIQKPAISTLEETRLDEDEVVVTPSSQDINLPVVQETGEGGESRIERLERLVEKLVSSKGFHVSGLQEDVEVLEGVEMNFLKEHLNTMNTVIQESGLWFTLNDKNNGQLALNGPKRAVLNSVYSMNVDIDIITSIVEQQEEVIRFDWDFTGYNNLVGAMKFVNGVVKYVKCS